MRLHQPVAIERREASLLKTLKRLYSIHSGSEQCHDPEIRNDPNQDSYDGAYKAADRHPFPFPGLIRLIDTEYPEDYPENGAR